MTAPNRETVDETIDWLVEQSMLEQVKQIAPRYSGSGALWRHPYAECQPRAASALASAWFTSYPASIITREGESVLATLSDDELWRCLAEIGIRGLHTGPMKVAGGLRVHDREFTPTVDGYFDRIGLAIDERFGTMDEYIAMYTRAASHGAIIIDDIVPAHTGKGADFRLAEMGYQDYPGLYHMVEIAPEDWSLLPDVPPGRDSVNLSEAVVDTLAEKGYIVGRLTRVIFYEPGVKETDWSATDVVVGVDGRPRRWVYLHYFKEGQPSLNWLDPSFAAQRLVIGDALHALGTLGARMLRLDANGFLGIERRPDGPAWSEGHPLSITANQLIAGMVRKVGGYTFQELNLSVDDIAAMSNGGADLSYDFITRPAYHHALVTGDTEFLRVMLNTMHLYGIDPASLIHALQNHDELTLELVHFWQLHANDLYRFRNSGWTGLELRELIRNEMYTSLTGDNAPYNLPFVTNGVACTTASFIAAALGIRDLDRITPDQVEQIKQVHLLLVMYNAFQPGVFAISGWDLVGALTLDPASVAEMMGDGDTRWIGRGAYDLVNVNPAAERSQAGLPRARALYGPINEQLRHPNSFASQLRQILDVRQRYRIYAAHQLQVPDPIHPGLLVMVHELPDALHKQVTVLNFSPEPIQEVVHLEHGQSGVMIDMFTGDVVGRLNISGDLPVEIDGYNGASYLLGQSIP